MNNIKNEIIEKFRNGDALTKLIFINSAIFIVISILLVVIKLFNGSANWIHYLMFPADIYKFIVTPWSIISYMFVHSDLFHILFNMVTLFYFGKLFLEYCTQKDLIGIYFLGGIAGAAFYMICYNFFPLYENYVYSGYVIGASAAVMAIVVAVSTINPERIVRLFFIDVKVKWIAIALVLLSFIEIAGNNAGGEITHLGGALAGFLFGYQFQRGNNITKGISSLFDKIADLFSRSRKPKIKVKYGDSKRESDYDYNYRKKKESDNIDRILDKIKQHGYDSLSSDEKKQLFTKK